MNFRLAELARRFTDIITHLTNQPFTWGAGSGDIEDQTDLATALGEKADKANTYTKQESDDLLDGKADQSELDATNQAVSANTDSIGELQGRFETGAWPMQLIGTEGGSINFTATYSRVGNMVNVEGMVTGQIGLVLTGDIRFVGLGYNAQSNNSFNICLHGNNIDYPSGAMTLSVRTMANSDELLPEFMAQGSLIRLNNSHITDGTVLRLSLTYITNDPFDS